MKTKKNRAENVFRKHQLAIARRTLRMSVAGAGIMGGMTLEAAYQLLFKTDLAERMRTLLDDYPGAKPGEVVTELTTYGWDGCEDWETLLRSCTKKTDPRVVYFIMETERDENGEYIPCIAVEGETGFHRTDWHWGTDLELARECADDKNTALGIDKKTAMQIQLGTMRPMLPKEK